MEWEESGQRIGDALLHDRNVAAFLTPFPRPRAPSYLFAPPPPPSSTVFVFTAILDSIPPSSSL